MQLGYCAEYLFILDDYFDFLCCFSGFDFEVIIIDDGSPDGTQQVAEELQRIYGKEKIVCKLCFYICYFFTQRFRLLVR